METLLFLPDDMCNTVSNSERDTAISFIGSGNYVARIVQFFCKSDKQTRDNVNRQQVNTVYKK